MNKLFCFFLLLSVTSSNVQNNVTYKVAFKPDKTYRIEISSSSTAKVLLQEAPENLRNILPPLNMRSENNSIILIKTGSITSKGTIPLKLEVIKEHMFSDTYTQITNQDGKINNLLASGHFEESGKMVIDALINYPENYASKDSIISKILSYQLNLNFPATPINIGEKFYQNKSLLIPLPNNHIAYFSMSMTFTLKEIIGDYAIFEIDQDIHVSPNSDTSFLVKSIYGKGVVYFDIKNQMISVFRTMSDFTFQSKIQNTVVELSGNYQFSRITLIE